MCSPAVSLFGGADNYRRLAERLHKEEDLRKLVVEELAHRLKNKIATIQSIISYQLREQPGLRRYHRSSSCLIRHRRPDHGVSGTRGQHPRHPHHRTWAV